MDALVEHFMSKKGSRYKKYKVVEAEVSNDG